MGMTGVMQIIRTIARPLVAAPFMVTGLETLRNPVPRAEKVAPTLKPLADRVSWLPSKDPETLVRIQGAISLGAGALFTLGRFQRLTTLLLAAEVVPALLTEHQFWKEDDPDRRVTERALMLKNAGLFGAAPAYSSAEPASSGEGGQGRAARGTAAGGDREGGGGPQGRTCPPQGGQARRADPAPGRAAHRPLSVTTSST
jgi:uncharacterized membrane protein YphA (DoxX/SURF4 family)